MSLRNRLFLWITGLFLLAVATIYTLEFFVTKKQMATTREELRQKILSANEKKRQHLEGFLADAIGEGQARINVLLQRLSGYRFQAEAFAPTQDNYDQGTWLMSSQVLQSNKWLDFVQNTNQGKLASLIIPRTSSIDRSFRVEINDDLAWFLMGDQENLKEPYLGIRLRFSASARTSTGHESVSNKSDEKIETVGQTPQVYLLFPWKQLLSPDELSLHSPIFTGVVPSTQVDLHPPWTEGIQLNISQFFASFAMGRQYVEHSLQQFSKDQKEHAQAWIEKELKNLGQDLNQTPAPKDLDKVFLSPFLHREIDELVVRYDELYLIWILTVMDRLNIFGGDLFSPSSPHAVAVHFGSDPYGEGIHTQDVFFPQAAFDDEGYFNQQLPPDLTPNLGSRIAVFQPFHLPHVFFGNTARFLVEEAGAQKTGYLTLGVDADDILQRLVLATRQTALLVTTDKVMGAVSDTGVKFNLTEQHSLPVSQILQKASGIIPWGDDEYYYLLMTPFPNLDIHFVLLNPVIKEFELLDSLNQSAERIIRGLLLNIHIIGISVLLLAILVLHYLARRITQPITQLATATCEIGEGHLEEVEIPIPSEKDTDEVASLCRSFDRMVKGLREKEKVKAVLNKVVSQEIAQEILKGSIRLGGEEKKVSILFADIRNFTAMTQNMPPKEVVDLLNVCMTKISHLVDQHGGVIDKYVGDEAMALFGAPVACHESAYKAILSAIGMIEALKKWNEQRQRMNLPSVEMGIGIHTGTVLAGNMGAENRLNYTVLGSNVNLAARLCAAAAGMEILISESALKEPLVEEKIFYEEIPPMTLKGFTMPVNVYRVRGFR